MITNIARTLIIILFSMPIIMSFGLFYTIIIGDIPEIFVHTCAAVFLLDMSILAPILIFTDP